VVLAHQGGWDEMLLVLVPIAIFAALLWVANRRANRARDERDDDARAEGSQGP
jgi:hypothetical protein